jgi:excisionase family DNA binding protein
MPLIPLKEARERLGVSKETMRQLVRRGVFTVYSNPKDRREKLVDTDEVDAYLRPKVIQPRREDEE